MAEFYKHLYLTGTLKNTDVHMQIWKVCAPQRVRMFLWLLFRDRLLTNVERARRGIAQSTICGLCGGVVVWWSHRYTLLGAAHLRRVCGNQ